MIPISGASQSGRPIAAYPREFDGPDSEVIYYIQYRGYGSPQSSIGRPGDIFIDITPSAYRLFIRYDEWREWAGVHRSSASASDKIIFHFNHPKDGTRTVWCSTTDILWYKRNSISKSKLRLFAMSAYVHHSFISAHELILESGTVSRQSVPVTQKFMAHKEVKQRGKIREKHDILRNLASFFFFLADQHISDS